MKSPALDERKFGAEFEFTSKYEDLKFILTDLFSEKKFHCDPSSYKSDGKKWELKLDYTTESELTTPIIQYNKLKEVEYVLEVLRSHKIKITKKDSLHLHFDVKDITKEQLLTSWLRVEPFIVKLFPKHRQKSGYACHYINTPSKKKIIAQYYNMAYEKCYSHHQVFSLENYPDNATIEIRISEGSLNYTHFQNWSLLCLYFLNYAKNTDSFKNMTKSIILNDKEEFLEELDIKIPYLINWINSRWSKYNKG